MNTVWPGGTIGIVGGGQLARMVAFEARRMGYRVVVLANGMQDPAAQVADRALAGAPDDPDLVKVLAAEADVITFDYEHVPGATLDCLEAHPAVHPSTAVMRMLQDRIDQRQFLQAAGIPQTTYLPVSDVATLERAVAQLGTPCVLKTRRTGYDGRGQAIIASADELRIAWQRIEGLTAVLERFVEFARELSIVAARDQCGRLAFYPVVENVHAGHVLRATRAPASVPERVVTETRVIASTVAASLEYVGVLAVEFFLMHDGQLLVNEVAPRTHNSGHYTYGACVTSQFEQHVRAICGLPLGDPSLMQPAVMLNLLGEDGHPSENAGLQRVLADPRARLHLYGKREARPRRKMGHILVLGDDAMALDAVGKYEAACALEGLATGHHRIR